MINLKITDLKAYLKDKNQKELIKEVVELAKKFPAIKKYYAVKLNSSSAIEAFEKYKKIIHNEFLPDKGFGKVRYSVVNKAISDYKNISNNTEKIAELMLYYSEIGVNFTNTYGDIDEIFYGNIERSYNNALEYIFKNGLEDKFKNMANTIMIETDGMGWGFADTMNEIYQDYYGDFGNEED